VGTGSQESLAEVGQPGLWPGWLAGDELGIGWLERALCSRLRSNSACVLPGGDNEDGWTWQEDKSGDRDDGIAGQRRRQA
jgi:hypothetical protein